MTTDMVGRTADRAVEQMSDAFLKDLVGLDADSIENALGFQVFVDVRRGERRVAAKVEPNLPLLVSFDHRLQHVTPAVGTVDIAGPQRTPPRSPMWLNRNSG